MFFFASLRHGRLYLVEHAERCTVPSGLPVGASADGGELSHPYLHDEGGSVLGALTGDQLVLRFYSQQCAHLLQIADRSFVLYI